MTPYDIQRFCHRHQGIGWANADFSSLEYLTSGAVVISSKRVVLLKGHAFAWGIYIIFSLSYYVFGKQPVLTIICTAIRFTEVFPLRDIKDPTISKSLIKLFTLVRLTNEFQSD